MLFKNIEKVGIGLLFIIVLHTKHQTLNRKNYIGPINDDYV